jgi:D-amino-acid dehydrogenase
MHVVVIGCGLAGVSTAYFLHRAGARVTVLDRAPAAGRETSYANGAMLTPSLADPWNAPGVFGQLARSLGRDDAPMLLHLAELPRLAGWGIRFLANARRKRFESSYLHNVALARYSLAQLAGIRSHTGIEFEFSEGGIIKVFEDPAALEAAVQVGHWLKQAGITHRELDVPGLVALQPMLAESADRLVGAVHYPDDQVGNARLYCESLARWLAGEGVAMRFSEQVLGFERTFRSVSAVRTPRGRLEADAFVLAAGCFSRPLARQLGMRIPVVPAKGYSVTVPLSDTAPELPVVDDALHAAVVPLGGDRLRVAGTAEFAGFDMTVRPERIRNLLRLLDRIYPGVPVDGARLDAWAGLRPMTPDGRPLLGPTRPGNLFLNTGHGALGWTLAAASGKVVAEQVLKLPAAFDAAAFAPDRF